MKIKYQIYPSLLNSFQMYLNEDGYEKDGEFINFVTFESLIDSINRVQKPTTIQQQKGIDFENDVIEYSRLGVFNEHDFSSECYKNNNYKECVKEISSLLPTVFLTQKKVQFQYKNTLIYGYADIVGGGKIIDIKTTSSYTPPKFLDNFQNLYLYSLKDSGFKSIDYMITNFSNVFIEKYDLDYDFTQLFEKIDMFIDFIEANKCLISDKKIFV